MRLDIMELHTDTFEGIDPIVISQMTLRVGMSSDIKTRTDLEQRVLEYVHLQNVQMRSVSLGNLTRRFNRICGKLKCDMREVLEQLTQSGVLRLANPRGVMLLVSGVWYADRLAFCETMREYTKVEPTVGMANMIKGMEKV